MCGEIWKAIPGHPRYEASNKGRIRLCVRTQRSRPGRILKAKLEKSGHFRVTLFDDSGNRKQVGVHRLVCLAFYGLPKTPDLQAAHRDGKPGKNVPDNIYWATAKENMHDRDIHGRTARGEKNTNSSISTKLARKIKRLLGSGLGTTATANALKLSRSIVVHIAYGRTWRHI